MSGRLREMIRIAPAVIAVALGVIYAVGAITTYAQLKAAGLNGVEGIALVPLDQILGQGIGRMVQKAGEAIGLFVFFGSGIALGMFTSYRARKRKNAAQGQGLPLATRLLTDQRAIATMAAVTGGLYALLLLVAVPLDRAAAIAAALLVSLVVGVGMVFVLRDHIDGIPQAIALTLLGYLLYVVSSTISAAFLEPPPLPHVLLLTTSGARVEGGLAAQSGGSWMVVQQNRSVANIDAPHVRRAYITYPGRAPEQTALDWLLGRPPQHGFPP